MPPQGNFDLRGTPYRTGQGLRDVGTLRVVILAEARLPAHYACITVDPSEMGIRVSRFKSAAIWYTDEGSEVDNVGVALTHARDSVQPSTERAVIDADGFRQEILPDLSGLDGRAEPPDSAMAGGLAGTRESYARQRILAILESAVLHLSISSEDRSRCAAIQGSQGRPGLTPHRTASKTRRTSRLGTASQSDNSAFTSQHTAGDDHA